MVVLITGNTKSPLYWLANASPILSDAMRAKSNAVGMTSETLAGYFHSQKAESTLVRSHRITLPFHSTRCVLWLNDTHERWTVSVKVNILRYGSLVSVIIRYDKKSHANRNVTAEINKMRVPLTITGIMHSVGTTRFDTRETWFLPMIAL